MVGIGDDGAVISKRNCPQILSADVIVDQIHFSFKYSTPKEVGARAVVANCSDIYAMGGKPHSILVTLTAPKWLKDKQILDIAKGIKQEAKRAKVQILGGDLSGGECLTISITAVGDLIRSKPTTRDSAKVGDYLMLSGVVGGSLIGLESYQKKKTELKINSDKIKIFQKTFRLPQPDYKKMENSFDYPINAAIDVSDGLISEVRRICNASKVGAKLDLNVLNNQRPFKNLAIDLTRYFLESGEEHVLLVTSPKLIPGWIEIGRVIKSSGQIWVDGEKISEQDFPGFRH